MNYKKVKPLTSQDKSLLATMRIWKKDYIYLKLNFPENYARIMALKKK
jgi:hypothetical protein